MPELPGADITMMLFLIKSVQVLGCILVQDFRFGAYSVQGILRNFNNMQSTRKFYLAANWRFHLASI